MRTIKFRLYSEVQNEMIKWDRINKNNLHYYLSGRSDNIKVMQFTGLKDKNRKEIYEDDIITFDGILSGDKKIIGSVFFSTERLRFEYGKNGTSYPLYSVTTPIPRIIGNIHETPELLKNHQ